MDLCALTASELSDEIGARRLSPVEVVRAHLDRIEALNDSLRAYVFVDEKGALEQARVAEAAIRAEGPITPLHGLPVAYKDVCDVAGMPTTAGSRLLRHNLAATDSGAAARLRQAGTIALGKLNTFEFATGGQDVFGEARNPWNLAYATGGSSTGAAAALAGRLTPLAIGTDTGGSVRIPASFCGIVALRATRGRIGREGVVTLSETFDEVGPMARTVRDCDLLFQGLTGVEPGPQRDLSTVRLGVPAALWASCDPEVTHSVAAAVQMMRELGAKVSDVDLPTAEYGLAACWAISYSEAFARHRQTMEERPGEYTAGFLSKVGGAACLTADDLNVAEGLRRTISAEFAEALLHLDAIALPATPFAAYPLGAQSLQADNTVFTRPVSCSGLPALALPCGFTTAGLPIGLQLVGAARAEATLFAIGGAYEQATPWHDIPPPAVSMPPALGDYWTEVKAKLRASRIGMGV